MDLHAATIISRTAAALRPPQKLLVSEWSDKYRYLTRGSSAEPGLYRTSRVPYMRDILNAPLHPVANTAVFIKPSQVGATEGILNLAGYIADQDPDGTLIILPTLQLGQAFSKDRLSKMFEASPQLKGRLAATRSPDGSNTILHKEFEGGHFTIAGANSAASLSSRPIRYVLCDEVDRFPASAGDEGDPIDLAVTRALNYWNRFIFLSSTPTIKGFSRIEKAFLESNQQYFFVPCPSCNHFQRLTFANVIWNKHPNGRHIPESARYQCSKCAELWEDNTRIETLQGGQWIAQKPEVLETLGFSLNSIYSPWIELGGLVDQFLKAKKDKQKFKVFVNTRFGETYTEAGKALSWEVIEARKEVYPAEVPAKAYILTAAVDVQDDRLEAEVKGWGLGFESWGIEYKVFLGSPGKWHVWEQLDEYLKKVFEHESGIGLRISCTAVDTGGHFTMQAYEFCRTRLRRRIYAIKGSHKVGQPLAGRATTNNKGKVHLYPIGTDTAKELIFDRLEIITPGPGYYHFPASYDSEYFRQLVSESAVIEEVNGVLKRVWKLPAGARNEALDLNVYNLAAYHILDPEMKAVAKNIKSAIEKVKKEDKEPEPTKKKRSRSNWAKNY